MALNLAKLLLITPGIAIELGFFFVVLLIFFVPTWRGGDPHVRAANLDCYFGVHNFAVLSCPVKCARYQ